MSNKPDTLLDEHQRLLNADPGYAHIWQGVLQQPPELRLLFTMVAWGTAAGQMRAMVAAALTEGAKP